MNQATISSKGDQIAIQTPFDRDFVNDLKAATDSRRWDRDNKVWLVFEAEADKAIEIVTRYFEVVDIRGKDADEAEEAQIEAEIARIKANQAEILEREEYIGRIIGKLDTAIGCYSYRSKSAIRGAMARERALLQHSLDNARIPVEQLTELQVRGMTAALKLIDGGYQPPRGAMGWS